MRMLIAALRSCFAGKTRCVRTLIDLYPNYIIHARIAFRDIVFVVSFVVVVTYSESVAICGEVAIQCLRMHALHFGS